MDTGLALRCFFALLPSGRASAEDVAPETGGAALGGPRFRPNAGLVSAPALRFNGRGGVGGLAGLAGGVAPAAFDCAVRSTRPWFGSTPALTLGLG